ncbi:MAG: gas vesicle protein K [Acidobacteriota bacterium]|nr:gas vesicle protein K [Acidobacteriota bacterium]
MTRAAKSRKKTPPADPSHSLSVSEIDDLREELTRLRMASQKPSRWNAEPDDVRKSVGKLVLTLVEFIRRVLERQAIRRHENGTLTPAEAEAVGTALMRLEETILEMAQTFGLKPEELNLELGPLGRLY